MLVDLLSLVIPLIFALTLLFIIWRIVDSWIINAGDVKKVEEGRKYAGWGILVLVVMVGIWAIVRILRTTLFGA